jgi:hypothetical protein
MPVTTVLTQRGAGLPELRQRQLMLVRPRRTSSGSIEAHRDRFTPVSVRPAPGKHDEAIRRRGKAPTASPSAPGEHSSLSAPDPAAARTTVNAAGSTTFQQPGTASATMPGSKLKKAADTGPAPTRPSGAARAAK